MQHVFRYVCACPFACSFADTVQFQKATNMQMIVSILLDTEIDVIN